MKFQLPFMLPLTLGAGEEDLSPGAAPASTRRAAAAAERRIGPLDLLEQRTPAALLIVLLGMVITAALWDGERRDSAQRVQDELESCAAEMTAAIQARMAHYEQVLRGGASLVATLGGVTRVQWHDYVAQLRLEQGLPGFQGIGWARYVRAGERAEFERGLRSEGLDGYTIRPPGERDAYGAVTYLEPDNARNLRAHGFDMLSDATRRAAMERARDSGVAALTGKLGLASEAQLSDVNGFLMYMPVYGPGVGADATVEQRRAALLGWVNSPYRINDLLKGVRDAHAGEFNLALYDGSELNADTLMHDDGLLAGHPHAARLPSTARTLDVRGHRWTLRFTALPSLAARLPKSRERLLALAGAAVSGLLGTLAWLVLAYLEQTRREQARLRRLTLVDPLTGLANRTALQLKLAKTVSRCALSKDTAALLYVDLDGFKAINDTLGHDAGDNLLRAVAQRLLDNTRTGDTAARLGGDEFCLLLARDAGAAQAAALAERVVSRLAEPFDLGGQPALVSASVGIALLPADGTDAETLLKRAHSAMYLAKQRGRQRFAFYSHELNAGAERRAMVQSQILEALNTQAFELLYQPVVDLHSGAVVSVEALLRLPAQGRPAIPTGELIVVAEQSGLIGRIGRWVVERALADASVWQRDGLALRVAINVSARQMHEPGFVNDLRDALQRHGVDASGIELELTETALLVDHEQARDTLLQLRQLGLGVVLDDFGTGYSSLSHLADFPISKIKIDRRFVSAASEDLANPGITSAVLALGRSLDVAVVAEGVETARQRDQLRKLGCRYGQGYFFSAAVTADVVAA